MLVSRMSWSTGRGRRRTLVRVMVSGPVPNAVRRVKDGLPTLSEYGEQVSLINGIEIQGVLADQLMVDGCVRGVRSASEV